MKMTAGNKKEKERGKNAPKMQTPSPGSPNGSFSRQNLRIWQERKKKTRDN